MKYMVIDDNQEWLDACGAIDENIITVNCTSTEEGIRSIEIHKPDIVFVDHLLSKEEHGLEIVKRVKNVIFYSTSSFIDIALAVEYIMSGATACLGKNIEEVKSVINPQQ